MFVSSLSSWHAIRLTFFIRCPSVVFITCLALCLARTPTTIPFAPYHLSHISTMPNQTQPTNRKMQRHQHRHQRQLKQVETSTSILIVFVFDSFIRLLVYSSYFLVFFLFFSFRSSKIFCISFHRWSSHIARVQHDTTVHFGLAEIFLLFDLVVFALRISCSVHPVLVTANAIVLPISCQYQHTRTIHHIGAAYFIVESSFSTNT